MSDRPTVLVLGGGHAEIPLIQTCHALGLRVVTTGNDSDGLGHRHADANHFADYSDRHAMRDLALELDVSSVVAGCNDFAAISAAYVAEDLGLGGHDPYETSLQIHHKDRFRHLLSEVGLPTPGSVILTDPRRANELCADLGFPVIVKPVDLTGGKGIAVCATQDEVAAAASQALALSREGHVVVEQFLEGSRHGFSCFVVQRKVGFWFADDERYYKNPYLVSGTATPSTLPASAIDELISAVEVISEHLEVVDGLMHVQCILTPDGPVIVELCRRCPGDLYPEFVRLATDFDHAGLVVRAEVGMEIGAAASKEPRAVARHCLMAASDGAVSSVQIANGLASALLDEMTWWTPGDVIGNHLVEKLGILFFGFSTAEEMRRIDSQFASLISVEIDPLHESAADLTEARKAQ